MKKVYQTMLTVIISCMLMLSLSAQPMHWYVKNNKEHTRPILPSEFSYISEQDAHYLGKDEKVIYLTFDAGYENGNVEKIVNILNKHNAKGAFFVLDNIIIKNTELIKRMSDEGHLICNHTAKHKNMSLVTDRSEFEKELTALENIYTEYTGKQLAKFYRPPEGSFSEENLKFAKEMGYTTVFWSFAYADWDNNKQPDTEKAIKKITDHIHNGEIMLLHPTSSTNAAILDRVLTELESQGYRFGTLDELKAG